MVKREKKVLLQMKKWSCFSLGISFWILTSSPPLPRPQLYVCLRLRSQPTWVCQPARLAAAGGAPWARRSAAGIKCTLISVQSLVTLIISPVLWLRVETLKQRTWSESRAGRDQIEPRLLTSADQKITAAPSLLFWKHKPGGFNKSKTSGALWGCFKYFTMGHTEL